MRVLSLIVAALLLSSCQSADGPERTDGEQVAAPSASESSPSESSSSDSESDSDPAVEAFAEEVNGICRRTARRLDEAPLSFKYGRLYFEEMAGILLDAIAELRRATPPAGLAEPYELFLNLLRQYPAELEEYLFGPGTDEDAEHSVSILVQGGDLEPLFDCDELGLVRATDLKERRVEGEHEELGDEYYEEKLEGRKT